MKKSICKVLSTILAAAIILSFTPAMAMAGTITEATVSPRPADAAATTSGFTAAPERGPDLFIDYHGPVAYTQQDEPPPPTPIDAPANLRYRIEYGSAFLDWDYMGTGDESFELGFCTSAGIDIIGFWSWLDARTENIDWVLPYAATAGEYEIRIRAWAFDYSDCSEWTSLPVTVTGAPAIAAPDAVKRAEIGDGEFWYYTVERAEPFPPCRYILRMYVDDEQGGRRELYLTDATIETYQSSLAFWAWHGDELPTHATLQHLSSYSPSPAELYVTISEPQDEPAPIIEHQPEPVPAPTNVNFRLDDDSNLFLDWEYEGTGHAWFVIGLYTPAGEDIGGTWADGSDRSAYIGDLLFNATESGVDYEIRIHAVASTPIITSEYASLPLSINAAPAIKAPDSVIFSHIGENMYQYTAKRADEPFLPGHYCLTLWSQDSGVYELHTAVTEETINLPFGLWSDTTPDYTQAVLRTIEAFDLQPNNMLTVTITLPQEPSQWAPVTEAPPLPAPPEAFLWFSIGGSYDMDNGILASLFSINAVFEGEWNIFDWRDGILEIRIYKNGALLEHGDDYAFSDWDGWYYDTYTNETLFSINFEYPITDPGMYTFYITYNGTVHSRSVTIGPAFIDTLTVSTADLPYTGGDITVTLTGVNLRDDMLVQLFDGDDIVQWSFCYTEGDHLTQTATINIPPNLGSADKEYTVKISYRDVWADDMWIQIWEPLTATVTVAARQADIPIRVTGAADARFISIAPVNGKASDTIRVLRFSVKVTLSNGMAEVREYSIEIRSNNNNPDGKYKFAAGHDLEGFTLVYDIKGNGGNIKTFYIDK